MTLEGFDCTDCGENTFFKREYYMLHNQLWQSAASPNEMLCVRCFEERLGRQLNPDDFVKLPINFGCIFPQSHLLSSRLYEKGHIYG